MGVAATDEELALQQQQSNDDEPENDETTGTPQDGEPKDPPDDGDDEGDEVVVQIGDEESPASEEQQPAAAWVKQLREDQKRLKRENAELKAQVGTGQPTAKQAPTLPAFPLIADYEYDEAKFQEAVEGWTAKKREVDAHETAQQEAVKQRQKAVQAVHENYAKSRQALKVSDFQDAEDAVKDTFSIVQQSILIEGASNPGALVYALGKTPKKLQELASIKDPVKFTWACAQLEKEVKVTKRPANTKPAPETPLRSNTSAPASTATLERLRADADKTGDRSKVIAYQRQLRNAGKK